MLPFTIRGRSLSSGMLPGFPWHLPNDLDATGSGPTTLLITGNCNCVLQASLCLTFFHPRLSLLSLQGYRLHSISGVIWTDLQNPHWVPTTGSLGVENCETGARHLFFSELTGRLTWSPFSQFGPYGCYLEMFVCPKTSEDSAHCKWSNSS